MRVYPPDGNPVEMDAVDARECVARCGYTLEPPTPSPETETALPEADPAKAVGKKIKGE